MVDTAEIKDDGLKEAQQQPTLDKSTTERPSWLLYQKKVIMI